MDDITSEALAMKQLMFLGRFSFGESKRDEVVVAVVAIAATSLEVSSSSSCSSSPDVYYSFGEQHNLWLPLNGIFFLDKGLLLGQL